MFASMAISPNTHIVYHKNVRMQAKGKGMMPNILSSKFDLFFSVLKPASEEAISLKLGIQLGLKVPPIPLQHHNLRSRHQVFVLSMFVTTSGC